MKIDNPVEKILRESRTIAIVGASPNPRRPSCRVNRYLTKHGYNVYSVHPGGQEILGRPSYPDLSSIPSEVDVVDVFRKSEDVMPIVEEAIKIGARAVWMQEGVVNEEAAARARNAGLIVVMDKCMRKEHLRLQQESKMEMKEA